MRSSCLKILWAPLYRSIMIYIEGPAAAIAIMSKLILLLFHGYWCLYQAHWLPTPDTVWGLLINFPSFPRTFSPTLNRKFSSSIQFLPRHQPVTVAVHLTHKRPSTGNGGSQGSASHPPEMKPGAPVDDRPSGQWGFPALSLVRFRESRQHFGMVQNDETPSSFSKLGGWILEMIINDQ